MDTGGIIKKLRTDKGMTQEELGVILGLKKAAIQKYENGSVENLKRSTIKKLAVCFDVSPLYIMGLDEIENIPNKPEQMEITDKEKQLIENFRKASNKEKELAKSLLKPDEEKTLSFSS